MFPATARYITRPPNAFIKVYPAHSGVLPPWYPAHLGVLPPWYPAHSGVLPPRYPAHLGVLPPRYPAHLGVLPPRYPAHRGVRLCTVMQLQTARDAPTVCMYNDERKMMFNENSEIFILRFGLVSVAVHQWSTFVVLP